MNMCADALLTTTDTVCHAEHWDVDSAIQYIYSNLNIDEPDCHGYDMKS